MTNKELNEELSLVKALASEAHMTASSLLVDYRDNISPTISYIQHDIDNIKDIVCDAISTAVHELIEFVRYDDLKDLNEEDFSERVHRLIFDDSSTLPF